MVVPIWCLGIIARLGVLAPVASQNHTTFPAFSSHRRLTIVVSLLIVPQFIPHGKWEWKRWRYYERGVIVDLDGTANTPLVSNRHNDRWREWWSDVVFTPFGFAGILGTASSGHGRTICPTDPRRLVDAVTCAACWESGDYWRQW